MDDERYRKIIHETEMNRARGIDDYAVDFGFQTRENLIAFIQDNGITSILDMGPGEGLFAKEMAEALPDVKITSVDIDPRSESVVQSDFADMEFEDDSFDLVISSNALGYYASSEEHALKCINEAIRVTKPDGRLIFTVYNPSDSDTEMHAALHPGGDIADYAKDEFYFHLPDLSSKHPYYPFRDANMHMMHLESVHRTKEFWDQYAVTLVKKTEDE